MDMNLMMAALAVLPALFVALVVYFPMKAKLQALEQTNLQQQSLLDDAENAQSLLHSKLDEVTGDKHNLEKSLAGMETQIHNYHRAEQELRAVIALKETKLDSLNLKLSETSLTAERLTTQLEEQKAHNQQALQDMRDAKAIMHKEFSVLANDILEQKGKTFSTQSQQSLEGLLKPFREELSGFKDKVESIQKDDIKNRTQLHAELKHLRDLNQRITDDADNLTKALKGEKKLQGNWGEIQLEKILETSGLVKGQEYEREPNFKDEEGKNKRPDFIVKLPEGKHLIIDSKVSLNAFLDYCAADDATAQEAALKRHVDAVKNHIKSLNEKDYPSLTGMQSPDFVFMFMPIEPAFNVALQADFKMFEEAFSKHIVIVTPTTLLATLKTVSSIWTIERQNAKSAELASKAANVYDKLRGFLEKMEKLDGQLNSTRNTFDEAMKTLRTGNGNLVRQAEQFKELGVRVKKAIPESVLAKTDLVDVGDAFVLTGQPKQTSLQDV
jgi:DNA recombination protein RmuC